MSNFKEKLKNYGLFAGAAIGATTGYAKIDTTDVNPDSLLVGGTFGSPVYFDIDFDKDSVTDFQTIFSSGSQTGTFTTYFGYYTLPSRRKRNMAMFAPNNNNSLMFGYKVSGSNTYFGPAALNADDPVSNNQTNWYGGTLNFGVYAKAEVYYNNNWISYPYSAVEYGIWKNVSSKYVGVKFYSGNGNEHFGWVRLSVDSFNITVEEYGYQDIAEVPVLAGDKKVVLADSARNVMISQIGPYGSSSDIEISFDTALVEDAVSDYRVILVKSSKAASFDVDSARSLPISYMQRFSPDGTNKLDTLNEGLLDSDGDPIRPYQAYKAFILSAPTGDSTTEAVLSAESNELTLTLGVASKAKNLTAYEDGSNDDGSDLKIVFDTAYQASISEYRAIVVKASIADSFDIDSAQVAVDSGYYLAIAPSDTSPVIQYFLSTSVDSDGDTLTLNVPYKVFIYSQPDGSLVTTPSLSDSSNTVTILNASPDTVMTVVANDYFESGDASDLYIRFRPHFTNDANVQEYQIIAVKSSAADTFSLADANQAVLDSNSFYVSVNTPLYLIGGDTVTEVGLDPALTDSDGDTIMVGVPYKFFVLTVGNELADRNTLSLASNEVTIVNYPPDTVQVVDGDDFGETGTGEDAYIYFELPENYYTTDHYKIIIAKSTAADSVDLDSALNIVAKGSDYYKIVNPNNYYYDPDSDTYFFYEQLNSGFRDSEGDLMTNGVYYKAFVVAYGDTATDLKSISPGSPNFILDYYQTDAAYDVFAEDVDDFHNGFDLKVSFTSASFDYLVSSYALVVVKYFPGNNFDEAAAQLALDNNYYEEVTVGKSDSSLSLLFNGDSKDSDGELIKENFPYRVYAVSLPDSVLTSIIAISEPSNEVVLTSSDGISEDLTGSIQIEQTGNIVQIHSDNDIQKFAHIVDLTGRLVYTIKFKSEGKFDISELSSGTYVVKVVEQGKLTSKKILKN